MARDWEIEGKRKQVEGKAQELKGHVTGKMSDKIAGNVKQGIGKVQEEIGEARKDSMREHRRDY